MTDPPNWKRIGETANKILDELEKIHGAENDNRTDKDDATQPVSGDGADWVDPVQQ